ncbi:MAG TPA: F0F1 ATP synthase subunit gamma [Candidatus Omnitrophota bacterium]|nr:F0F1 ATP synthase subunit gamma [Candidatus Omnitrophota bacterium]
MGKVTRIKGDMDDVDALLEIISVIKDVATNRFFAFAQRKANFQKFFEAFLDFFSVMQNMESNCPLLRNDNPKVTILTVASDQAFMSQLNSRVASIALQQYQKYPGATVASMGRRCAERMKMLGVTNIDRIFTGDEFPDRYVLALKLREYAVDQVMSGKSGKVIIVHLWAKTFSIIKPRILTLLPASELLRTGGGDITDEGEGGAQADQVPEAKTGVLIESSPDKMMKAVADIWIHSRLFEIMADILLVESAVQAQQLESALESLGSEKKGLLVSFRKAGRDELNKAMREVFTQTSFTKGPKR